MKAWITVGCSASGKSTWADNYQAERGFDVVQLNRDSVRQHILTNDKKIKYGNMWSVWKFDWEKQVDQYIKILYDSAVSRKQDIIISDTNLNPNKRNALKQRLESDGYEVEIMVFGTEVSVLDLWKRDEKRVHTVGRDVIMKQYQQFRKEFPKYDINKDVDNLRECVIVDIDGTITNGPHERSAYEWDKVGQDLPNKLLISMIQSLYDKGNKIVFLSGRDSVCRKETIQWLEDMFNEYHPTVSRNIKYELFMRKENDMRKDTIVKTELYFEHIDGKYNVVGVFDDRPCVVRDVWLEMGFDVYARGNPYIEF